MFTVIYYIYTLLAVVIFLTATLLAFPFTVPFDASRRVVHEISRGISMVFLRTPPFWRTRVRGLENVRRGERYVIVLNHSSMVDILMLYWVPLNFRWISRDEVKRVPFIGQFLMLHGDILIPRDRPREAVEMVMREGVRCLRERGVSVAIFPEGTRSKTGEMGPFKRSAFTLAQEAGVGILPVVLGGSRILGKGGRMPWRHDYSVTVLEPVSAEEVARRDTKEIMEETRARMVEARAN